MGYEFLEHTADVMFRAYGSTWSEVFERAALATFAAMVDVDKVRAVERRIIELAAETLEELLYAFLSELIYLKDAEGLVFSKFRVSIEGNGPYKLRAEVWGEKVRPEHNPRADVKAITFHEMELGETDGKKYAQVVLDV